MKIKKLLAIISSVVAVSVLAPSLATANEYPEKPITWVVPFKPGGGTDRWSRVMSSVAEDVMGHSMRVRNIPGNSALRGWQHMLKQPADGHTVIMASPTPLIAMAREGGTLPFDSEQVKIVCFVSAFRNIMISQPDKPWSNWDQLLSYAKNHPGDLSFGATMSELSGAALAFNSAGIDVKLVPYGSTSDAVTDLLGGHLDMAGATESTVIPLVPDKAVALLNGTRSAVSAEVSSQLGNPPHAAELGYEAIDFPRWIGVHPDTPDETVEMLSNHIEAMLQTTSFTKLMNKMGEEILFVPREQAQQAYNDIVAGVDKAVNAISVAAAQ